MIVFLYEILFKNKKKTMISARHQDSKYRSLITNYEIAFF